MDNQKDEKSNGQRRQVARADFKAKAAAEAATNKTLSMTGVILLCFAFFCFIGKAYFDAGEETQYYQLEKLNRTHGPFTIEEDNATYQVEFIQSKFEMGTWNAITVKVLDAQQQYVYGFGDEIWREVGIDEGQVWDETKNTIRMNLFFEKQGDYYFAISSQANKMFQPNTSFYITLKKLNGSSVLFRVFMWFGIIFGCLILLFRYREELGKNH